MEMKDLLETADLSRIPLGKQDMQSLPAAMEQMLALLDTMKNSDADLAMPAFTSQADFVIASAKPVDTGFLRPDEAVTGAAEEDSAKTDVREFMLSQAGERDGNFIVIPNVL